MACTAPFTVTTPALCVCGDGRFPGSMLAFRRTSRRRRSKKTHTLRSRFGALTAPGRSRLRALSYDDRKMIRYLALLFTMAAVALCAPEDEIRAADQLWAAAVKSGNTAALERIYTGGLIYAHASGKVENKSQYIDRLKSGKQKYNDVVIESAKVVVYGDSAISLSVVRMRGTNDDGPFNDHVMMMHVWVKQRGGWHLAAHQTTKIP